MVIELVSEQAIGLVLLAFAIGWLAADLSRPDRRRAKRLRGKAD